MATRASHGALPARTRRGSHAKALPRRGKIYAVPGTRRLWEGAPIVELAKVREAGGAFERHARGDGPHVGRVHVRLESVIWVGKDAPLRDAIEKRQTIRVVNGEPAGVECAVPAVWVDVVGLVEEANSGLETIVLADEVQPVRRLPVCHVLEVVQCVEEGVHLG